MFTSVFTLFGLVKMSQKPANLRTAMPQVTAWIDDLRAAFGAEAINAQIRAGMSGLPTFHATEAGHSVGTPAPMRGTEISAAQMVLHHADRKPKP